MANNEVERIVELYSHCQNAMGCARGQSMSGTSPHRAHCKVPRVLPVGLQKRILGPGFKGRR